MWQWLWEKCIEKTIELIQQGYEKLELFIKTLIQLINKVGEWFN